MHLILIPNQTTPCLTAQNSATQETKGVILCVYYKSPASLRFPNTPGINLGRWKNWVQHPKTLLWFRWKEQAKSCEMKEVKQWGSAFSSICLRNIKLCLIWSIHEEDRWDQKKKENLWLWMCYPSACSTKLGLFPGKEKWAEFFFPWKLANSVMLKYFVERLWLWQSFREAHTCPKQSLSTIFWLSNKDSSTSNTSCSIFNFSGAHRPTISRMWDLLLSAKVASTFHRKSDMLGFCR